MTEKIKPFLNRIVCGDALTVLKTLPEKSVDCVVTSPPYWIMRDYGVDGQLGLEPDIEEYLNRLLIVFDEVHRVLKDEGTCWVNLGDTYGGATQQLKGVNHPDRITPKSLALVPFRFAVEMTDTSWVPRDDLSQTERSFVMQELVNRHLL